jgi:hypothetical protein
VRRNLDWEPFFAVAASDAPYRDKLASYAGIARERLSAGQFEEFCAQHLAHLDEIAYEFFGANEAREAVRKKVAALYPAHEIDQFTELFFGRIQKWREQEGKGG